MSFSPRDSRPGLPTTHYFVSVSRGDSIRTLMLTPAALWVLVGLVPASLGFGLAGVAELASGGRVAAVVALRAADAGAREEAERGRDAETDALEARLNGLAERQARLEQRGAVVAARAEAARGTNRTASTPPAADALGAIQRLVPGPAGAEEPAAAPGFGAARAYAPASPARITPRPTPDKLGAAPPPAVGLAVLAANPNLNPPTRLAFVERSLSLVESGQMTALAAVDRTATEAAGRNAAILADAGLDVDRFAARPSTKGVGGPFVPIEAGPAALAFDRAAARIARDVAFAQKLDDLMGFLPFGRPLAGDAPVASPFGVRIDPFLGRPALHSGVDLVQPYGTEVRAAGAGRVIHAGPMGGYGEMVEIDHGDGLTSRYGHLSDVLVGEGDELPKGAIVGRLGSTGRSTGPHLHYEVRIDGEPVDPERFLRAGARLAAVR